eukprot:CAMPEP_0119570354 /NCGR_PEP_ID=MMETSP1352-20130426/43573_1 /TAXON_ID=265584 /ORGANISM="Stauroneis constricta, Strain CCMP1120" /LENGTH=645 /DNA_ID=CAMNT_0007620021 /DNA_START=479 /DNA_END=2416 /DNA_ORIENTATION=-
MTFPNTQSVAAMVRSQSSSNDNSHSIQDFESSAALAPAMSGHQGNAARASSSSFTMLNNMNMGMNTGMGSACGTRAAAGLKPNSRLAESLTSLTDIDFLIGALEPSCSSANAGTAGMASNARTGNNNAAGLASRRNSLAWMMPLAAQQQPHNNSNNYNNGGDAAAQVLANQANNASGPAVPSSAAADVTTIAETVLSEIDDDLFKEDLFPLPPSAPVQAAGASGVQAASASSFSGATETQMLPGAASNSGNTMDGSSAGLQHQFDSDLFEPTPIERMNRYLPQVPTSFMVGHHQHGSTTSAGNGQQGGAFAQQQQQQLPLWLNAPSQNFMFSGFSANNANPGMNMNMNMDMLMNMDASSMGIHGRVSSSSADSRSPLKRSAPDDAAAGMISDAAANSSTTAGASSAKRQRRCVSPSSSHASAASASMHVNHVLPTVAHSSAGAAATRAPPTPVAPSSSSGPSSKQQHRAQQRKEADLLQTGDQSDSARFRGYQEDQWNEKFEELCAYMNSNGHTQVPHRKESSKESLSRWCKRQRYQYKLLQENKPSTMTLERIRQLESIHFVWDSHGAIWEERLQELKEYRSIHGHCSIPSNYSKNQKLATWVKCQRRQRKLFCAGKKSNMTLERSQRLDALGFIWELRCHGGK